MAHDWQPDFEPLVDEHQSMVFSLAWRMTGDRGLAEEVAQDVFLELDRHMERIESPEHAMFWLRRVAMNRSADALRRRKVRGVDLWIEIEENHGTPSTHSHLFPNSWMSLIEFARELARTNDSPALELVSFIPLEIPEDHSASLFHDSAEEEAFYHQCMFNAHRNRSVTE